MAQDIISDALNKIDNSIKAGKSELAVSAHSKTLLSILALAKLKGYILSYKVEKNAVKIEIAKLNKCQAIKPRFVVSAGEIEKYVSRYLPAKDIGIIVVSTNQGLMAHTTAIEKNLGGCLMAYFY